MSRIYYPPVPAAEDINQLQKLKHLFLCKYVAPEKMQDASYDLTEILMAVAIYILKGDELNERPGERGNRKPEKGRGTKKSVLSGKKPRSRKLGRVGNETKKKNRQARRKN